jgi:ribosomal protein RSM22 (predicted rRNA methylase)
VGRGPGRGGSRIHEGLVGRRELIGTRYLGDPELRREYAAEIAPRTTAALGKILPQLYGDGPARVPAPAAARVLDLGAGTGAAGAAARAFFGPAAAIVSVDRVAGPGVVTADLGGDPAALAPRLLAGGAARFDVILAAHLLNELLTDLPADQRIAARARRVEGWCRTLLAAGGTFIIVEPALRETSRELLAVRDRLCAPDGAGFHVVAPCFWQGPCPALARDRDWCHDAVAAATPGAPRVDFSYLCLRAAGAAPTDRDLFRIVSDPLVEKGRLRLFGCGPAGRHALVRLDRQQAPTNEAFDRLARGDVARVSGATAAGDGLRVGPDTVVSGAR